MSFDYDNMRKKFPRVDFLKGANNVYRTEYYIVSQSLKLSVDKNGTSSLISIDTYYLRDSRRDFYYDLIFALRDELDGKRIKATMYIRKYVE